MARKRRNKHSKYTNEKHLELIGITAEILLVISCTISIYKKSDVIVTTILTTIAILLFFALLIYFVNKIKRLEKDLQKEKNEIRKLRKKTCKICKIVYASMVDQSISFDENFDKYALPFPYYEGDDDSYMLEKQLANLQLQEEKKQEQQALQIQQSFGYAEAEKWIELGLEPEDVYFADWLVEEKGCTPERSTKEYIKKLNISDNDFSAQDLSVFRKTQDSCWSLKKLIIGNNRFYGNLEPLEKLVDLELLDIKHTDIEGGIEYLPESIKFLFCDFKKSEENELSKIYQELELFQNKALQEENKQLQEQKTDLKKQIQVKNEELVIERETNRESAELMDNFYRKNPPREDLVLKNILCGISNDYLETNRENKQLRKEIQELEKNLETVEKLLELHDQEQQTAQILQPTNQPYGTPGSNKK
ncbi:9073_t:CDS:2 [Entrophospora sp. SA101]|nr:9073_t:CDS:2 [Entrophospora sp. SA101]